ncbi:MAG: hypothetical protein WCD12_00300 [Candidatus Binatus sp.]|jgi:hypothetical protein|uniref:hypothetical protein n=1 Tax=Candidatus Binatus sp. TaxID=2811406 RepID=UPI003C724ED5
MTIDGCCGSESPIACELGAISAADRPRYDELRKMLAASAIGKRELSDGVAVRISTERMALAQLAEWISFERKCCPFLDFRIDVAPESGPVWVSLTGRAGVKEFLAHAFGK